MRLNSFVSQISVYRNTAIEPRGIHYRRRIPLLELGRELTCLDVSKIVLTHQKVNSHGK